MSGPIVEAEFDEHGEIKCHKCGAKTHFLAALMFGLTMSQLADAIDFAKDRNWQPKDGS